MGLQNSRLELQAGSRAVGGAEAKPGAGSDGRLGQALHQQRLMEDTKFASKCPGTRCVLLHGAQTLGGGEDSK